MLCLRPQHPSSCLRSHCISSSIVCIPVDAFLIVPSSAGPGILNLQFLGLLTVRPSGGRRKKQGWAKGDMSPGPDRPQPSCRAPCSMPPGLQCGGGADRTPPAGAARPSQEGIEPGSRAIMPAAPAFPSWMVSLRSLSLNRGRPQQAVFQRLWVGWGLLLQDSAAPCEGFAMSGSPQAYFPYLTGVSVPPQVGFCQHHLAVCRPSSPGPCYPSTPHLLGCLPPDPRHRSLRGQLLMRE